MDKRTDAGIVAVGKDEDNPKQAAGLLIPTMAFTDEPEEEDSPVTDLVVLHSKTNALVLAAAAVLFMFSIGITTYVALMGEQEQAVASPIIVLGDQENEPVEMKYGSKVAFSEPSFFADIKEALILSNSSFIEADLTAMMLRYHETGEVVFEAKILSKGEKGSLAETPAGLYVIEEREEVRVSPESGATHPWSMLFQGNFYIHGQPYFAEAVENPEPHSSGGIRLADEAAEILYNYVSLETPVLVHEEVAVEDDFVYEPTVPEITAEHYLVADIDNNAVLAGSDMDQVVPIASVTKLMTAMVAIEHFNVEDTVDLTGMTFASTTVPRLSQHDSISIYDLLRLMLVESSNEAANVIADQMGRSKFVGLMNDKAASLGLTDTSFGDPSGLSASNVSTLRDLLHFTQYLYNNRSFILKITADSDLLSVISQDDLASLNNFNDVEGDDSFMAGKVGETTAAGQTSISLHKITVKDSDRVIAVVILNSENRPEDVRKLTQYINDRFSL